MAQHPIELILLRQWAAYLQMPVWIMGPEGDLLYYNEPAEQILGVRFDDVGAVRADQLASMFDTASLEGMAMPSKELPIVVALEEGHPAHASLRIRARDQQWRDLQVTAFPVVGLTGDHLGAAAIFWEQPGP